MWNVLFKTKLKVSVLDPVVIMLPCSTFCSSCNEGLNFVPVLIAACAVGNTSSLFDCFVLALSGPAYIVCPLQEYVKDSTCA